MDVEFMVTDSIEVRFSAILPESSRVVLTDIERNQAIRPKLALFKTVEEAAIAVDEMFTNAYQTAGSQSFFVFTPVPLSSTNNILILC